MKKVKFYFNFVRKNLPHTNPNTVCRFYTDIKDILDFSIHEIKDYKYDSNFIHFYILDATSLPLHQVVDLIPKNIYKKNFKNLHLIIYLPTEGDPQKIVESLVKPRVHENKVFFITGNLLEKHYTKSSSWRNYSLDYFEESFKQDIKKQIAMPQTKFELDISLKNKDFLCLNGRNRSSRFALVSELFRNDLIKNSIFSYIGKGRHLKYERAHIKRYLIDEEKITYAHNLMENFTTYTLDQKTLDNDRASDQRWYDSTYFSLVTETLCDDNVLFFTEKTWKPIAYGHPFILWHSRGSLRNLRRRGYETFPELFDENYDDLAEKDRLDCIVNTVRNFCNLDVKTKNQKIKDVAEKIAHNQKHFFTERGSTSIKLKKILISIIRQVDKT